MLPRLLCACRLIQPHAPPGYLLRPSVSAPSLSHRFPTPCRHYAFGPRRPSYSRFQEAQSLWKTSPPFRIGVTVIGGGITVWIGSNIEKVPISGRYRFNCVSEEYEARLGKMGYQQVMQQFQGQILRPSDPRHKMVGRVLQRLLPNSGLNGDWEYHVIDDKDQVNAFVVPGLTDPTEIAHNVAHHAQEKASLPYLITLIVGLVTLFIDNSAQLSQAVLTYGLDLPNSRAQEAEADHLGLLGTAWRNKSIMLFPNSYQLIQQYAVAFE
ncbi:MAG: hypothetical protein Q9181_003867 [Wetmoreana brouardii]